MWRAARAFAERCPYRTNKKALHNWGQTSISRKYFFHNWGQTSISGKYFSQIEV
jgi:hypothetical protein